jgi:hypothetical protein
MFSKNQNMYSMEYEHYMLEFCSNDACSLLSTRNFPGHDCGERGVF